MNISQLPLFLRKPLITVQTMSMQLLLNRSLLLTMGTLQLLWLLAIVITGTSTKYDAILTVAIFSVIATFVVILLPDRVVQRLKDLKVWLVLNEKRSLLLLCLSALLVGILYAFIQRPWSDEQRSFKAASITASEGLASAYEKVDWLSGQHPPLFSLLFSLAFKLPGPDLLFMRLVSVSFLAGTLIVTYYLGRELYGREIGYVATILLLSFPLVLRLSAAAKPDIQVTFFFMLALLLLVRLSRKPSYGLACAAGVVIGLGLLTKYMMALLFVVLFFYFLFMTRFRKIKFHLLVVGLASMSVFAIWILYAFPLGILDRQIHKILGYTGSYHLVRDLVEASPSGQPATVTKGEVESTDLNEQLQSGIFRLGLESLFTRIPSSLGVYHAPLILVGLLYLIKKRKAVDLVLLLWIGGVSAGLLLTLPAHRYFLPIFPAIAIAVAHLLLRFPKYAERVILLSLFFGAGNLYLFANWVRESQIF
jgi:4-amino-4-deoxy-L-arabinose transferase-like glycosyltransferase